MKNFTVMKKQPQIIKGHIIPVGSFYGFINLKFSRKVPLKKYTVTDKDGYIVFNEDGTEKTAWTYRLTQCEQPLYYSVETTETYKDDKGREHLIAYIAYDDNSDIYRWHKTVLGGTALTKQLENFILLRINNWLAANNSTWFDHIIEEPKINVDKHLLKQVRPHVKRAQSTFIYKGRPLNEYDECVPVRERQPIIHTNIGKMHPVDERPVYSSRVKSKSAPQYVKYTRTIVTIDENGKSEKHVAQIKDTVCSNPANGGYIRNENGTVTTRDGKTVKTRI